MSEIENLIQAIKDATPNAKIGLIGVLTKIVAKSNKLTAEQAENIKAFAYDQIKSTVATLKSESASDISYRDKDEIFCYSDALVKLFATITGGFKNAKISERETIEELRELVSKETVVENAVIKMFSHDVIVKSDVETLLDSMKSITDAYRVGIFYSGLFHYREKISKFEPDAKALLAEYIVNQTNEMLDHELDDDEILSLEFIADICVCFPCKSVTELLNRILKTHYNRSRYYAVDSLLTMKAPVEKSTVRELAEDISLADMLYEVLKKHGRLDLYPPELADEIYLAKSDLSQWLLYPTELGKLPDKMEYMGETKIKKEKIHVFKYMSDSDNLTDDLKNVWLIGWSGNEGGTFSEFAKLSDYEKKTPKKTLKTIIKKLIK